MLLKRPYILLFLACCSSGASYLGDHNGSWLHVSTNDIRVSPLNRTVFTLQSDGNWIIDFQSPEFSGTSVGTYTIDANTMTTVGSTGFTVSYLFSAHRDSLILDEIRLDREAPERIAYVRVSGREAVFNP